LGLGERLVQRDPKALAIEIWKGYMGSRLKAPVSWPRLYILSGLPFSGKSYFARKLIDRSPADVVYIENDLVREMVAKALGYGQPVHTKEEHTLVFETSHNLISLALSYGYHTIFDATNLLEKYREPIYSIADANDASVLVIRFNVNSSVAESRDRQRSAQRDADDHSKADYSIYELLTTEDEPIKRCSRRYIVVDTSAKKIGRIIDEHALLLR